DAGAGRGRPPRPGQTRTRGPHARARAACRREARPGSLASPNLRLLDLACRTPRLLRIALPQDLWFAPETGRTKWLTCPAARGELRPPGWAMCRGVRCSGWFGSDPLGRGLGLQQPLQAPHGVPGALPHGAPDDQRVEEPAAPPYGGIEPSEGDPRLRPLERL